MRQRNETQRQEIMKKFLVKTHETQFEIYCDLFHYGEGSLDFILDHESIASFKNWEYIIEIRNEIKIKEISC